MTPHKYTPGGSYILDRRFKHIGRVHLASGITREADFLLFNAALTEMSRDPAGREWIRAMLRGEVAPIDVWGIYKKGDEHWRRPPRPDSAKPLVKALEQWLKDFLPPKVAQGTYVGRKAMVDRARECARSGATIDELPIVLRAMKRRMMKTAVTFNLHRNYLRAFVRDTLGTRHELYQVIKHDIGAIHIPGYAKRKERKRHPLSPAQVLELAAAFSTKHPGGAEGAPGHGYNAIQMALTGTNPKEYFVDGWTQTPTYVHVHGEKREGRDRMVPKLFPSPLWPHPVLKRPTITKHSFERAFAAARKAAGVNCTPLDLRRSFANWMESAGIERNRRRLYRGHGPKDIGDQYETPEILKHLAIDGQRMVAWITEQLALAKRPQIVQEGKE